MATEEGKAQFMCITALQEVQGEQKEWRKEKCQGEGNDVQMETEEVLQKKPDVIDVEEYRPRKTLKCGSKSSA